MATSQHSFPKQLRHGSGAVMTLDQTRLLIAFRIPQSSRMSVRCSSHSCSFEDERDERGQKPLLPETNIVNHTTQRFWARTVDGRGLQHEEVVAIEIKLETQLEWIGPVYRLEGSKDRNGLLCPVPNALLLRFPAGTAPAGGALDQYQMHEVPEKSKYLGQFRYYQLDGARPVPVVLRAGSAARIVEGAGTRRQVREHAAAQAARGGSQRYALSAAMGHADHPSRRRGHDRLEHFDGRCRYGGLCA